MTSLLDVMDKYICIHGHFYQPPRENAWLEEVELQDSSYPYHDWNERITEECYAPNTASRILDAEERIVDIVNNYSKMSFNFGPSLLSWMERHRPETYQAILDADRLSMENFSGHGSAMAQVYNHMIMPLANRRDKYTQVIWGIRDFEHRFKRFPEGMWLPETAVDLATLEILVDLGISFTILAPNQARRVREVRRGSRWKDVSGEKIDPTAAYLCRLPSGKSIAVFFYDGPISRDIAFGGLLSNGEEFARRLMNAFSGERKRPQLVHIATDGETYGHHHRGGDMALAYCLYNIESKNLAKLTNYAEFLEMHPPAHEVEIFENSSWSCVHGIERWRDNCGCNSGAHPGWTQAWRNPLRETLDELRFSAITLYEEGTEKYLRNPWKARNDYISVVLDRSAEGIENFFRKHAFRELEKEETVTVLKFLEMQRNAMLMYTSCGWFFDEISGIETVQIMQYASKVIQLAMELQGASLEQDFMEALEASPSNVYENGMKPYELFVKPAMVDLLRVGTHYAISSVFHKYPEQTKIFCYTARSEEYEIRDSGRQKLVIGKARIISDITLDEETICFAVLHLGYHDIVAGVSKYIGDNAYSRMKDDARQAFDREDIPRVRNIIRDHFREDIFSLSHLFRDEQRKVIRQLLQLAYEGIDASCRDIYDNYREIMSFFQSFHIQVPKPFRVSSEHILNRDLKRIFEEEEIDTEKLNKLITEITKWSLDVDKTTISFVASSKINSLMEKLSRQPEDAQLISRIEAALKLMSTLPVELDLWKAQNIYFSVGKKLYRPLKDKAAKGESEHQKWVEAFRKLGYYLRVKIA
jgi:alpha-amylase/alpha-mannosidase (GH57 family)